MIKNQTQQKMDGQSSPEGLTPPTPDVSKYASPMPVIGLYIALATTVCLLFMLYDIFSGFRQKKHWFPCRLFSLNSVTLTLIAIASKLPVDLTTDMPGELNQVSKLTGVVLIWTCMIFFLPSLGSMRASESLSNTIALTILVFTIFVDIWLQLVTGVINLINPYMVITLVCLVSSLLDFWISSSEINNEQNIAYDRNRENLINGNGTMMERLKWCYVRSYISNPQLLVCMNQYGFFLWFLYIILTFYMVLLATISLGTFILSSKKDYSDYKWSIPILVAIQIITILVSNIVNISRCFMFTNQIDLRTPVNFLMTKVESLEVMRMTNNRSLSQYLLFVATKILIVFLSIRLRMIVYSLRGKAAFGRCLIFLNFKKDRAIQDPIDARHVKVEKWIERKGEKDIDRWIDVQKRKSPRHLIQFLSETLPSDELLSHRIKKIGTENNWEGVGDDYKVSCLSAVILVRMASDLLPYTVSQIMIQTLDEAFPIILFIDKNLKNMVSFETKRKFKFAERLWKCWDFKSHLNISDIGEVTSSIRSLLSIPLIRSQRDSYFDFVRKEVGIIKNIICLQRQTSDMDLYDHIKQLVVDMLHEFLCKFPIVVLKYVAEASPGDSEVKIKLAISLLCKLKLLEDKVQWEFPCETDITNLITNADYNDANHDSSQAKDNNDTGIPTASEGAGESQV